MGRENRKATYDTEYRHKHPSYSLSLFPLSLSVMPATSWYSSCTCITAAVARPNLSPDTSTSSDDNSTAASTTRLQSNASLQTLPSVPSLQKLSANEKTSLSHLLVSSLRPDRSQVTSIAISSGLLYSASSNQIRAWEVSTLDQIDAFNFSGDGSVKSLVFSDGRIFTAHQDCKIRVWEFDTHHRQRHRHVASLPTLNDRLLRSLLAKNYVPVRRHKKRLWVEHDDAVSALAVCKGLLYSVSWDKTLKIWRISDLRCLQSVTAHGDAVNAVAVAGDGTVYTGSADSRIRVWAREKGEKKYTLRATLEKHKSAVNALALDGEGTVLYSGACDRSILVWEREDSAGHMALAGALRGHSGAILCLINAEDLLLSGSADRTVRIWGRGIDGQYACLGKLEGHAKAVKSLGAVCDGSESGYTVYSGSLDGEIRVWRLNFSDFLDIRNSIGVEVIAFALWFQTIC
ncbi:protein JINGUBANG-like [Aristolochia californica]|uniref:protein JINGUBANG-like n=1 Tax=Aristolochia californica TaxID=171875 RepID=UPI0035D876B7